MSEILVLCGCVLAALSGLPGALFLRRGRAGERVATAMMVAGAGAGTAGAITGAIKPLTTGITLPWNVPGGQFALRVDALAAMFVVQVFVIAALGSVYGLGYWAQRDHPTNGRKLRLFYGLLTGAMGLLLIARNSILFLVGWELMALSAFLALTTEDEQPRVREAGYLYLVATRFGTLCLFALFALLQGATGTFDFDAGGVPAASATGTAVLALALVGFGFKAGIMPLHIWLPGAHANAPSHVSAFLSGVLIKMGIYGLVRVLAGFDHPPLWWGGVLLVLGMVSGVVGVALAIGQHDVKRLLAYHSVENIGIICMGLGVALVGRAAGRSELVVLGLAGALLHVWNHGLFKALLFLSAGAVVHATGTREIDRLGGLLKRMPSVGLLFLLGAVAICGLPPLNGFVSEWLIYLGVFHWVALPGGRAWVLAAFAAPSLALIGALALACFTKVFSAVFLGEGRSPDALRGHDPGRVMTVPMVVLAACCVLIGVGPLLVVPVLEGAVAAWAPEVSAALPGLASLAPVYWMTAVALGLAAALAAGALFARRWMRSTRAPVAVTWDCGYAEPSARMQYTASSFAQALVRIFSYVLRPREQTPRPEGAFPREERFESHVPDAVLDDLVLPAADAVARGFNWLRWIQRGSVQMYLSYVLFALLLLLLWR